jgi:methylated-DNA-[protein]-cysteine S-methyltransferase
MTPFTRKVYKAVLSITLGDVRSYQWVAVQAGNPRASRAVGGILKRNPYPLIIPCHRVIAADGGPGGYSGGLKKKLLLLDLERKIKICLENKG